MNKSESKYFNTAVKMNEALIALLKKKSFEYITVSEICKTAGVNRSTFYLHYENLGDLLSETSRHLIDEFISDFDSTPAAILPDIAQCDKTELNFVSDRYLIPYLTYIKDNKEVFATALSNTKSLGFENVYKDMFRHLFNPILQRYNYPPENRKYVMMYYLNGITAIITQWLEDGCEKSVTDISSIVQDCIFGLGNSGTVSDMQSRQL